MTNWENRETTSTSPLSSSSAAAHEFEFELSGLVARARFSERSAGSFAPAATDDARRHVFVPLPWSWLHQVHGPGVHRVVAPGAPAGEDGDALVTTRPGCAMSVQVADCAPVVLFGSSAVGVAHAGWRGLHAGVLDATVTALRDVSEAGAVDGGDVFAVVGPHIGPECYEFGGADLEELVARFGPEVASTTAWGTAALDLGAAVRAALSSCGVQRIIEVGECTSCEADRYFSHRARGEIGRHAMVVWMERLR